MALQLSGVSAGFAGSPQVLLQRERGGKEILGQGEAWEPIPPKSRKKTFMGCSHTPLGTQLTTGSFLHSHGFSPQSPLPNHRPEPHTPNFYQEWHRMLATAAGQDQLSPQAPRAGAEGWRQGVGGLDSPISLSPL